MPAPPNINNVVLFKLASLHVNFLAVHDVDTLLERLDALAGEVIDHCLAHVGRSGDVVNAGRRLFLALGSEVGQTEVVGLEPAFAAGLDLNFLTLLNHEDDAHFLTNALLVLHGEVSAVGAGGEVDHLVLVGGEDCFQLVGSGWKVLQSLAYEETAFWE